MGVKLLPAGFVQHLVFWGGRFPKFIRISDRDLPSAPLVCSEAVRWAFVRTKNHSTPTPNSSRRRFLCGACTIEVIPFRHPHLGITCQKIVSAFVFADWSVLCERVRQVCFLVPVFRMRSSTTTVLSRNLSSHQKRANVDLEPNLERHAWIAEHWSNIQLDWKYHNQSFRNAFEFQQTWSSDMDAPNSHRSTGPRYCLGTDGHDRVSQPFACSWLEALLHFPITAVKVFERKIHVATLRDSATGWYEQYMAISL